MRDLRRGSRNHPRHNLGEVFPALRVEGPSTAGGEELDHRLRMTAPEDAADAGNGNAADAARQASGRGCCEEKFVILAAVKRLGQRRGRIDGKSGGIDLGGDTGFFAKMSEIGG